MSEWEFDAEVLMDAAREETGLSNFGDPRFTEGLNVLLETLDTTASLSEKGRKSNWKRLEQLLSTRLKIEQSFATHPEIREREIRRPVYLTGLPRTGTSALFNLLGTDPAARPLLLWEAFFPDPLDDLPPGEPDPRLEAMKQANERMRASNPDFTKIHFTAADTPEECVLLLAYTFENVHNGIEALMEPYQSWFQGQNLKPSYAYYRDLLKMLDHQRHGDRWLLKSPAHLWAIDAIVDVFPDCCIIMTHRDVLASTASYCSMMETLFEARGCAEQPNLGETVLEWLARAMERAMAARDASTESRFYDVRFDEFVADPMAVARRIYDHFELPMPDEALQAMRHYVEQNPKGKHGAHSYDLERYGLSEDIVQERLREYIDRFDPS
jgi:hypothetical protein